MQGVNVKPATRVAFKGGYAVRLAIVFGVSVLATNKMSLGQVGCCCGMAAVTFITVPGSVMPSTTLGPLSRCKLCFCIRAAKLVKNWFRFCGQA